MPGVSQRSSLRGVMAANSRIRGPEHRRGTQMFTRIRTALMACAAGAVITAMVAVVATATPAMAYGKANWQTTFAGTATFPSTGNSFGFWGWCDFAGGVASGTSGDCQLAQYVHTPAGSGFTCHESIDLTAWTTTTGTGTFVITGSATVN